MFGVKQNPKVLGIELCNLVKKYSQNKSQHQFEPPFVRKNQETFRPERKVKQEMYSDANDILVGETSTSQFVLAKKQNAIFNKSLTDVDRKANKRSDANMKRPNGMHRELFNLLVHQGKDNNIHSLVPSATKKGYTSAKAKIGLRKVRKWYWRPFVNPGRNDGLKLSHWERVDHPTDKVYVFAKLNKTMEPCTFTDSEYYELFEDVKWSKNETSHLLELCNRFDLRWPIIEDRFDRRQSLKGRKSMEDMKERYYSILNALRGARITQSTVAASANGAEPTFAVIVGCESDVKLADPNYYGYDAEHEKRRKEQLQKLWERTEEQVKEEEELKVALKRIEAKRKERERKAHDLQRLINAADRTSLSPDSAASGTPGSATRANKKLKLKSTQAAAHQLISPSDTLAIRFHEFRSAGSHFRSQEMKLPTNIGQKKQRNIETVINALKLDLFPHGMEEIVEVYNTFRSNIVILQDLKTALLAAETELNSLNARLQVESKQTFTIEPRMRVSEAAMLEAASDALTSPTRAKAAKSAPGAPSTSRRITALIDVNPAGLVTAVSNRKRKIRQTTPSDSGTPPPSRSRHQ